MPFNEAVPCGVRLPPAEASTILVKFFILMKEWPWPRAIHLRVPEEHSMGLPVWDPRPGTRDSQALMPVITPAYPAMNSLYNVRRSTLEVGRGMMCRTRARARQASAGAGMGTGHFVSSVCGLLLVEAQARHHMRGHGGMGFTREVGAGDRGTVKRFHGFLGECARRARGANDGASPAIRGRGSS